MQFRAVFEGAVCGVVLGCNVFYGVYFLGIASTLDNNTLFTFSVNIQGQCRKSCALFTNRMRVQQGVRGYAATASDGDDPLEANKSPPPLLAVERQRLQFSETGTH